jgi:osmotically inducible protein OsmC
MDLIYKTRVFSQGGRNGRVQSEDGTLKLDLAAPAEMGGKKPGSNPEQLFAAAWAACFENSVRHIVRADRLPVKGCMVEAEISLFKNFEEAYRMAIRCSCSRPRVAPMKATSPGCAVARPRRARIRCAKCASNAGE